MPRSLPAVIYRDREAMLSKAEYTRLEQQVRRKLAVSAQGLITGRMTPSTAYMRATGEIKKATLHAFHLGKAVGAGRRVAATVMTSAEVNRANDMADYQCARLRAWLLAGQPLERPGVQGIGPRLDMYGLSLHAAYQTGLAFGLLQAAANAKGMALLEDDPIWLWKRSKAVGIQSCADCIEREKRSAITPYTLTELLTLGFPASGHTKCLTRCRCFVVLTGVAADDIMTARAHRRAKSTAYHGVVDPTTTKTLPRGKVGNR